MVFFSVAFNVEKKSGDKTILHHSKLLYTLPPPGKQWSEPSPNSPPQNKGFINHVFCRNWAVRKPAGTRLDSSLVNKQVESDQYYSQVCFIGHGGAYIWVAILSIRACQFLSKTSKHFG